MELLSGPNGILTIVTNKIILPGIHAVFDFPTRNFTDEHLKMLMDNPKTDFYILLMPTEALRFSKPNICVMITIRALNLTDDSIRIHASGHGRVKILEAENHDDKLYCTFETATEEMNKPEEIFEKEKELLKRIEKLDNGDKLAKGLRESNDPSLTADTLFTELNIDEDDDQTMDFLLTTSVLTRIRKVYEMADKFLPTIPVAKDDTKKITSNNPEIAKLLENYYTKKNRMSTKAVDEIERVLRRLATMSTSASDYTDFITYAEFATELPFKEFTEDNNIEHVEKELKDSHYGMDKAKERLVEYLAIKKLNPDSKGMILLLDGAPGTGKTTLAKSFAKALGRKCERISMGGCADAHFIKGFERSYKGARHGRIAAALHHAGVSNPVIILDEVEKVSMGMQGDPDATLLEVLDPETNHEFTDNYLGFDMDLSKVIFIATSNNRSEISPAVYDRMEYIPCDGYSRHEKIKIATEYTIPKVCKDLGIKAKISKKTLTGMINGYTREAGVRTLEKIIKTVLRKIAVEKAKGKDLKVTKRLVEKRLGKPYTEDKPMAHDVPGIVTGMYYSEAGGGCLDIEAIITNKDGSGDVLVTGKAGEVMTESIDLVHSHVVANAKRYGLTEVDLSSVDIHLHMPDGSTPKDGPSAGAAYSLLFASLAANKPVKSGLAMTGECTLTGRITPIGGVDQKCAGAVRLGMTDIILPEGNKRDYDELPVYIKKAAKFHFVSTVKEVLEIGLERR